MFSTFYKENRFKKFLRKFISLTFFTKSNIFQAASTSALGFSFFTGSGKIFFISIADLLLPEKYGEVTTFLSLSNNNIDSLLFLFFFLSSLDLSGVVKTNGEREEVLIGLRSLGVPGTNSLLRELVDPVLDRGLGELIEISMGGVPGRVCNGLRCATIRVSKYGSGRQRDWYLMILGGETVMEFQAKRVGF